MSFVVAQRTQEFGVRMALGAPRARVLHEVLGEGTTTALIVFGRRRDAAMAALSGARTAQHSGRKHDDAANDSEHAIDRNADDAEWNQKDPDDGVDDDRQ